MVFLSLIPGSGGRASHEPWQELPKQRLAQASRAPLPHETMAERECQAGVQAAPAAFSPEPREVAWPACLECHPLSAAADRLGTLAGTVKSRMGNVYWKIRQSLGTAE
jgi:DNA-directed RNA polymerase specialized sigma24 family protein